MTSLGKILALLILCVIGLTRYFQAPNTKKRLDEPLSKNDDEQYSSLFTEIRQKAFGKWQTISSQRTEDVRKEHESFTRTMQRNEFMYLDQGSRFKRLYSGDYEYWPSEDYNSTDYYEYYITNGFSGAVVVGIAEGASLSKVQLFVGSLRKTGYTGMIMLAVHEDIDRRLLRYLQKNEVTVKYLNSTNCSFPSENSSHRCYHPYHDIHPEWGLVQLVKEYLVNCYKMNECSEMVIVADVSETYFQLNPFGPGCRFMKNLEFYEENPHLSVATSTIRDRILACTDQDIFNKPLISSGVFAGPITSVIKFLDQVYDTMRQWMKNPICYSQFHRNDDLKAIFNYLRLSRSFPVNVTYYSHRTGIVNNVGYDGSKILQSHLHFQQFRGHSINEAMKIPFEGAEGRRWIGKDYLITDDDGYFINLNFQRSILIYQYDKFGEPFLSWLEKNSTTMNS